MKKRKSKAPSRLSLPAKHTHASERYMVRLGTLVITSLCSLAYFTYLCFFFIPSSLFGRRNTYEKKLSGSLSPFFSPPPLRDTRMFLTDRMHCVRKKEWKGRERREREEEKRQSQSTSSLFSSPSVPPSTSGRRQCDDKVPFFFPPSSYLLHPPKRYGNSCILCKKERRRRDDRNAIAAKIAFFFCFCSALEFPPLLFFSLSVYLCKRGAEWLCVYVCRSGVESISSHLHGFCVCGMC